MREIKFRAWHKMKKTMVHFDIKTITETPYPGFYYTQDLDGFYCELDDPLLYTELMQYTELKDKNEVEIYEGDRVRWHTYDGYIGQTKVEFRDGRFYPVSFNCLEYDRYDGKGFEVIGNIYSNPELLKGQDND